MKKTNILEIQRSLEVEVRKKCTNINHKPYWESKSIEGYFKPNTKEKHD